MNGNQNEAKIYLFTGASGSGKTTRALTLINKKKQNRTLIWSPKEAIDNYASKYAGTVICSSVGEVLAIAKKAYPNKPFHVVFKPALKRDIDEKDFHAFCKIALAAGNAAVIVDELHTVTRPTWSPDGWRELVMMGRGYAMTVCGMSQRPADMDKSFFGNASIVNTGRLSNPADQKTMAEALGVKKQEIAELNGYLWVERNNLTGKITKG